MFQAFPLLNYLPDDTNSTKPPLFTMDVISYSYLNPETGLANLC